MFNFIPINIRNGIKFWFNVFMQVLNIFGAVAWGILTWLICGALLIAIHGSDMWTEEKSRFTLFTISIFFFMILIKETLNCLIDIMKFIIKILELFIDKKTGV